MNQIRLLRLNLEQFKGQKSLHLDFGGNSATIYGENGTGKSSIYDAVTWLLFGKDSTGQSNFEVKPLGEDKLVKDHNAITSVEAVFACSGDEISFRKTFYEKWSTKRGSAADSFDGNTSDYFVDDVPSKKYEFERRIEELVSEDVFHLLTDVTCFCAKMDWRTRREVLFHVCGIADDREILGREERFAPLLTALGKLTLDDYKKKILAERKGLCGVRNDVPVRMSECQKTIDDLEKIDFETLRTERLSRVEKSNVLSAELLELNHNTRLDSKKNERGAAENRRMKLEHENDVFRKRQVVHERDDKASLCAEQDRLSRDISRRAAEQEEAEQDAEHCDAEVAICRTRWMEQNGRQFAGAACPTCGQALCGDALEHAKAQFNAEKSATLDQIVAESQRLKQRSEADRRRAAVRTAEIAAMQGRLAEIEALISAIKPLQQPEICDLPDYYTEHTALCTHIAALDGEIASLSGETAAIRHEVQDRIAVLSEEITAIEGTLCKEEMLFFMRDRMEELRAQANNAALKIEALDHTIFLCEEFTRYKIQFIEESINSKFSMTQFRLFVEQVNGGLADCCDVVYRGVPYGSLNNGARVNLGIDIISTLSEHYGVRVPLFVDNAESVTELAAIETQVIRLVVSQEDKELRFEAWA